MPTIRAMPHVDYRGVLVVTVPKEWAGREVLVVPVDEAVPMTASGEYSDSARIEFVGYEEQFNVNLKKMTAMLAHAAYLVGAPEEA